MFSYRVLLTCTLFTCTFIFLWTASSWNYRLISSKYNLSGYHTSDNKNLKRTNSNNNDPKVTKVLLVAYLRGGSSFLGDLVQSSRDSFYIFEPLLYLLLSQIQHKQASSKKKRKSPSPSPAAIVKDSEDAVQLLHDIFDCNFLKWQAYVEWVKENKKKLNIFQRNQEFWRSCKVGDNTDLCYDTSYLSSFCLNSSLRVIKVTRLSTKNSGILLTRLPQLKVVHLVRDPRAVLNSRHRKPISKWCKGSRDCWLAQPFCKSLKSDLISSCTLRNQFPKSFVVMRYEDLACRPYEMTSLLFKFLNVQFGNQTSSFLDSHTSQWESANRTVSPGQKYELRLPEAYSTYRVSKNVPFMWQMTLSDSEIYRAESYCETVLEAIGLPLTGDFQSGRLSCDTLIFNDTFSDRRSCPVLLQHITENDYT